MTGHLNHAQHCYGTPALKHAMFSALRMEFTAAILQPFCILYVAINNQKPSAESASAALVSHEHRWP